MQDARRLVRRPCLEKIAVEEFAEIIEGSKPLMHLLLAVPRGLGISLVPVVGVRKPLIFFVRHDWVVQSGAANSCSSLPSCVFPFPLVFRPEFSLSCFPAGATV